MNQMHKLLLALVVCTILVGCSKINQEDFDKVQLGMSIKQVTAILGEPMSKKSTHFAGMSGTTAKWKNRNVEISILFFNDKVQYKNFQKSD